MDSVAYEKSHLYLLRHSTAHVMAQALTELFPGIKLTIGPPIENGFYYDAEFPTPLKEEDLAKVEQKMRELANIGQPFKLLKAKDRQDAKQIILNKCSHGQGTESVKYKLELMEAVPENQDITFYEQQGTDKQGNIHYFIDLCRGPHLETTKEIKHFKLMSIAGAYWRGNVNNVQLTRIYGTAFETKDELVKFLERIEEAKKRDHRKLGKELGLFHFSAYVGTGLAIWLPKGTVLRETLIEYLKMEQLHRGYQAVVSPHIASSKLFEKSGHLATYKDKMFPLMHEQHHKETFVLKPMNCPFHIEVYSSQMRSYRDLPIRYAEFGTVYRYEQSGEVAGILRARGFTTDDAHLFVRPDQLLEEFKGVVDLTLTVLKKLGLTEFKARVGTKGTESKFIGSDENWELAQTSIEEACKQMGLPYFVSEGDAAFYGPKLDIIVKDALGREWQMGTVQVDYNLPERFELEYIGEDGKPHRPIMIHRAPFGSMERMIGLLIEHYGGVFPDWLAPVQVAILPIADRHVDYAHAIAELLQRYKSPGHKSSSHSFWPELGKGCRHVFRVYVDDRRESLGKKIREHTMQKVPYTLIVGDKDIESGTVSVRSRKSGDLGPMFFDAFVHWLNTEVSGNHYDKHLS